MTLVLPTSFDTTAIIQVAMDEEAAPFLDLTTDNGESFSYGEAELHPRTVELHSGQKQPILLVRSRIGLTNAAAAITTALHSVENPALVISAGTAGGLRADVQVGDIVVGTDYLYADADATVFGYTRGQVPGMPQRYRTAAFLINHVKKLEVKDRDRLLYGTMLSGGSFITAANVADTRQVFPQAISTDMETTAIAQVCASHSIPFIATRGISDLCGPAAGQDFHLSIDSVAPRSAEIALAIIKTATSQVLN